VTCRLVTAREDGGGAVLGGELGDVGVDADAG